MKSTYPKISCICITDSRPELLERAIACFLAQNYLNKELVISFPAADRASRELIAGYAGTAELNLLLLERNGETTLGEARNRAIYKCTGDYVCIWDDDDWHHSSRLSFQYNSMQLPGMHYQATVLNRVLLYDETTGKAYVSFPYSWDGTMLCRKEILLQNQYAALNRGEDTHVMTFLNGRKMLYKIEDAPFLYVYIYHGKNTWDYAHFEHFIKQSEPLDEETTAQVRSVLKLA